MDRFSRREFVCLGASLTLLLPLYSYAMSETGKDQKIEYPKTILVLKQSFKAEMIAHKNYLAYIKRA